MWASNGKRQNESKGLLPRVFQEPLVEARLADKKRTGHVWGRGFQHPSLPFKAVIPSKGLGKAKRGCSGLPGSLERPSSPQGLARGKNGLSGLPGLV